LQSELQKEIIALEVELQLGSAKELEEFKNIMIQANMELEYGYTENLATHQANLEYLLRSNLITDQGAMNIIEDYLRHLNSLEYLKQQGAQDIELQEHHQQFQAAQADKAQDIPQKHWTTLFDENLQARKDQVGELTKEDYQTAFYLTLDQITEWNEDGTSDREEKLPQLFQALQDFPQIDKIRFTVDDKELLESKGVIQPIQPELKPERPTLGRQILSSIERGLRGPGDYISALYQNIKQGNWWDPNRSIIENLDPTYGFKLLLGAYSPTPLVDALYKTPTVDNLSEQPSLEELSPVERALLRLEEEDRDSDIYLRRILSWPTVKPYFNLPYNIGGK
jgi:hypothetical protein